ncbi:uncharacterized protein LOC113065204 isoform X2 [Carassius auratus]|uniref:Uncharacterized protein LOC113065204 isoform X2 n=1 Tax=Carassius auratus TaxID=7957 RepID=A0A6P6M7L9_CARAU|nr:uncharacterized protein LOC113065204 isoform X2 [Carassius auratus]
MDPVDQLLHLRKGGLSIEEPSFDGGEWSGFASGQPASSCTKLGGSQIFVSGLQDLGSTSVRRPFGVTLAQSSLISIMAHQSTGPTRLPRSSGSTLVIRQPALTSGL